MNFTYYTNRIAYYDDENNLLAEVTFPDVDHNTVNINHTFVDATLRGQGIADKLMESLVERLLSQNKKAVPTCSYALKWFEQHPEYSFLVK